MDCRVVYEWLVQKRQGGERLVCNIENTSECVCAQYLKLLSLFLLSDSGHGIAQVCRHGDHPPKHVASVSLHARWRSRRWPLKGGPAVKESPSRMDQWEAEGPTGSCNHPSTTTQPCTWALCILVRCHHWNTFLLILMFIHSFIHVCMYVCIRGRVSTCLVVDRMSIANEWKWKTNWNKKN